MASFFFLSERYHCRPGDPESRGKNPSRGETVPEKDGIRERNARGPRDEERRSFERMPWIREKRERSDGDQGERRRVDELKPRSLGKERPVLESGIRAPA